MAIIKFGMIVTEGRGKLGGHDFSVSRSGAYIRKKVIQTKQATSYQTLIRSGFSAYAQQWNQLGVSLNKAWNEAVINWSKTDIFGDLRNPSGKNLFIRLNQQATLAGYSEFTAVPSKAEMVNAQITNVKIETQSEKITFIGLSTDPSFRVMIFATTTLSHGTRFIKNKLRLIYNAECGSVSSADIYSAYESKFGTPSPGANISFGVRYVLPSGQASPIQNLSSDISAFIFSVKTDNAGVTAPEQFQLPLNSSGTYNAIVNWGDGVINKITSFNDPNALHTYASAGTYYINITGILSGVQFVNSGDKLKILNISNWGIFDIAVLSTFYYCSNLTIDATDSPKISSAILTETFRVCSNLISLDTLNWDVSSVARFHAMFMGCTNLIKLNLENWNLVNASDTSYMFNGCNNLTNYLIENWNVSNVTRMNNMFSNCDGLNISFANWNIESVNTFTGFMTNASGISTENYNATLISWSGQSVNSGLSIDFGGSSYTLGGAAETARTNLITNFLWTIVDGGGI